MSLRTVFMDGFNHRTRWNREAEAIGYDAAKIDEASFPLRVWVGFKWAVQDARERLAEWIEP